MQQPAPQSPPKSPDERVVCYCFDITANHIRQSLTEASTTLDDLIGRTGLGTKCTACLLDVELILDEVVQTPSKIPRPALLHKNTIAGAAKGLLCPHNQLESGVLIEAGDTHTRLRCVNRGLNFGDASQVVPYKYWLRVFSQDGILSTRHQGVLNADDSLDIAFSDLVTNPFKGWFLLALKPGRPGLEGSIRPQVALVGANYVATVHTQPHWSACRQKSVLLLPSANGFNAAVSIINAAPRPAKISLVLATPAGHNLHEHNHDLTARGSCILDMADIFTQPPAGEPIILRIVSDQPVRKHLITRLSDGRLGIDHFPNSK